MFPHFIASKEPQSRVTAREARATERKAVPVPGKRFAAYSPGQANVNPRAGLASLAGKTRSQWLLKLEY